MRRRSFSLLISAALLILPIERAIAQAALPAIKAVAPDITAAVERFPVQTADGRALGEVFVTSFTQPGERPVLFSFNGGPGAASAWLTLGALGPLRAAVPSDPSMAVPADVPLERNPATIVNTADLVAIDPLGTGFSRLAKNAPGEVAYDWHGDGRYVADVIREWLARHGKQHAPIYLIGESYGTERAVAVSEALADESKSVDLRGVVLVSQSITVENTLQRPGNDLGTAVGFPTIAATACYHRLAAGIPLRCAQEAYDFSMNEYLPALLLGAQLPPLKRSAIIARLSSFTGLKPDYFAAHGLALTKNVFRLTALSGEDEVLGIYDTRYIAHRDPRSSRQDPSTDTIAPAMRNAALAFYADFFGLRAAPADSSSYVMLDESIGGRWRYGSVSDPYSTLDMMGVLASVLRHKGAKLMIAGGLYDTAGSWGADLYLAGHIGLSPDQILLRSYGGGHMFYFDDRARAAFLGELSHFIEPNKPR